MNIIPMQPDPYYKFDIVIDENRFTFEFVYNTRAEYWTVSVSDSSGYIANGVPLLSVDGMFDQYNIRVDGLTPLNLSSNEDPNIRNIADVVLFQLDEAERNAAIK